MPDARKKEPTQAAIVRQRRLVQASPAWRTYGPIALVAVLGVILSALATINVSEWEKKEAENAFREASRDRVLVVQREIEHTIAVVQDIASLFESPRSVSRREFRRFVGPALKRLAGIGSLEWVPRVSAEDRAEFVHNAQLSFPPFQIMEPDPRGTLITAQSRPVYFPVLYVQPYKPNKETLGLDLGSVPEMLQKFEQASAADSTLSVSWVDGGEGKEAQASLIARIPAFRKIEPQDGKDEEYEDPADQTDQPARHAQDLLGFAIGRFRIGDIVERALRNLSPSGIDMRFFAEDENSARKLLYIHYSRLRPALNLASAPRASTSGRRELTQTVDLANLHWVVTCSSVSPRFQADAWTAWFVLLGGLAFTALLTAYLTTLVGRSEEVRRLVAERTRQLVNAVTALKKQIANRQRAERKLQQLNETLEMRVAQRTRESQRRADELEQFAYVASHDLKAPLRAIANLASWLEEDLRGKLDTETRNQLELMQDRVRRMRNLIDGLLEYSRVGRIRSPQSLVNTKALLVDTIDSLSPPAGFSIRIDPEMPTFNTDRLHLGQVFANLIGNAIKHHGGTSGNIRVRCRDRGDAYEFSVSDDGQGIEPAYHEKMFMMFQTLATKDRDSDTGIGLALVQKIVQEHGGSIIVDSDKGRGARFRFQWPKED